MERDIFDNLSPIDYRYKDPEVEKYLSENAFTKYKLQVECALAIALAHFGICTSEDVTAIEIACEHITTDEVYAEEKRIKHDIRALVNCIRKRVPEKTKPFVHMTATSYDIIDTANAMRYRDVVQKVLIPNLKERLRILTEISIREAETLQIGRTHGQHAVPITFGFAMSGYVSRLGKSIVHLQSLVEELPGKFSGAVGAYNSSSLFLNDPEEFEAVVLRGLGLKPAEHSTQIVPPESLTRLFCEVTIVAGILANLADDMRHLQRTEIGEVGEPVGESQVGSSTMPQKRNPINFENAKSLWKVVMPRIVTIFMDQISEHQRDLTNSASSRTYGEMIAYTVSATKRLTTIMERLSVDRENMDINLRREKNLAAEPLYLILAALGYPDAHEAVRVATVRAREAGLPLSTFAGQDQELGEYFKKMSPVQWAIIVDPTFSYFGLAVKKAKDIARNWRARLL